MAAFTQTDTEPMKVLQSSDTQTDTVDMVTSKTQTDTTELKVSQTQTVNVQTSEESMQTDKKIELDREIQVNLRACEVAEIEV